MQLRRLTAAAVAVPLALFSIGVAHADSNDDDFVQKVNNVGVEGAPADLITNAHLVCQALGNGSSPDDIVDGFVNQMHFQSGRAAQFAALSVTHYCPQYGNMQFKNYH